MAEGGQRFFQPRPMLEALAEEGVEYVLIGGTAAVIGGATHLTFDLDVTPARDQANLDRVAAALRRLNARLHGISADEAKDFQLDGESLARGSTWKFLTDHGELDIVLDPDGTRGYKDLRRRAELTTVYGMDILVASLEDVIRSKEAANRPRDQAVLDDLRRALELRQQDGEARGEP